MVPARVLMYGMALNLLTDPFSSYRPHRKPCVAMGLRGLATSIGQKQPHHKHHEINARRTYNLPMQRFHKIQPGRTYVVI